MGYCMTDIKKTLALSESEYFINPKKKYSKVFYLALLCW